MYVFGMGFEIFGHVRTGCLSAAPASELFGPGLQTGALEQGHPYVYVRPGTGIHVRYSHGYSIGSAAQVAYPAA